MNMSCKVGVTLGDPAGIGPEIVAKSLSALQENSRDIVLIGNRRNFSHVLEELGIGDKISSKFQFMDINPATGNIPPGKVSPIAGDIAVKSIEAAVKLAMEGQITGICTAPINKEAIIQAGSRYIDHTEMLSGLTGSSEVTTVFETRKLRILFLSKHLSLKQAIESITEGSVRKYIGLSDLALRMLGVENRKIAVAALNPHGGENGLFGSEEKDILVPAIEKEASRYDVSGPYPADSVFHMAAEGEFGIVLSLFHDQGHIAAKMYDFHRTVSMNIGLPFLRTSVDHGTAFEIAGKWIANETGMAEAIKKALAYSGKYRENYLGKT